MTVTSKGSPRVIAYQLAPSGSVPNHPRWPLLVYPGAIDAAASDIASTFEDMFTVNGWPAAWRNGIHSFHHFHCDAHEVLGVFSGEVTVQFGGNDGVVLRAQCGDVIVLPAGTGHKKLAAHGSLGVVGAYPMGQHPDMCTPLTASLQRCAAAIARVPLPRCDPVCGTGGPLLAHWK
jgi:uncharacterized protein YjlB